ncbi:MAG: DUF58 domain-containing protein [Anaerolineales bacterium]|nr:DUF58 domain-containing protein [Anaerolineales bacterium]
MDIPQHLTRKIRLRNYSLPVLVAGLFSIQFFTSDRAWEILLAAFGGALLLSAIWGFSLWQGLSFRREMRQGWAQVGDRFSEQFTVSNKSLFPALAVTIIDHSNFPGYKSSVAWPVAAHFDRLWFMDSFCSKRGLYNVGPTEIRTGDPFGVFEISVHSAFTKEILITPPIVPLRQVDFASGDWHGNGGTKAKMFERTVTAGSVREYVTGDSLFSIHWLTTARRDRFYVRTYDQQPSSDWWIILDMDRYVQVGHGLESTEEYAAIVAASIADRGLKENRAVGLIGEGRKPLWLPPKTGAGQRGEIMHALAVVKPGNLPLRSLLASAQRYMARKSSAIIITPSVDPAWLPTLTTLKQRGITTTVLLLNPLDFGGILPPNPIDKQLDAWGIRRYQISKNIYSMPKIEDFLPNHVKPAPENLIPIQKGA